MRIEDIDPPREPAGAIDTILWQLDRCGLRPDGVPLRQSTRSEAYRAALTRLVSEGWAYPCACSRREIAGSAPPRVDAAVGETRDASIDGSHERLDGSHERVYRNTCRDGLHGRPARAVRLRVAGRPHMVGEIDAIVSGAPVLIDWHDRRLGDRHDNLTRDVGDFVLKRADGHWAYQLAVVVDDAAQAVTDVVRGEDLASNTARQIYLQGRLGLPTPRYLHTPLVLGADGRKLSKQNGAAPLALNGASAQALATLQQAGRVLGLTAPATSPAEWLERAVPLWRERWPTTG